VATGKRKEIFMKYPTNRRANVRTIRKVADNGGLTFRNGKIVTYKTGYQVGLYGIEVKTPEEASKFLHSPKGRKGNTGLWLSCKIYYLDVSKRVSTKKAALELARQMNQQSIYDWANDRLIWCK
jgi:hypothetical protein